MGARARWAMDLGRQPDERGRRRRMSPHLSAQEHHAAARRRRRRRSRNSLHPQRVCRRSGGTWSIFSMSCAGVGPSARRVACAVKCARRMALPAKRASVVLRLGLFGIRGRDHLTSCWYGDRKGQCRIKKPSMSARCRTQRQDVDEAARASKHQNIGLKVPRSSAFCMAQRPAPPCPVWATTT